MTFIDGNRFLAEASLRCPLDNTCPYANEKLQFRKEKPAEARGPLLNCDTAISVHEPQKSKKRTFEESEKEPSNSPQAAKQKYVCLTVQDWDLLNSY